MSRRALAAAAVVLLAGCPFHPRNPMPRPDQGEWARARDRASRHADLYDGLIHKATATATFLSPEVREARARRLAEWLSWTQDELERRLQAEQADAAAGEEFVVALYTADTAWNDLDARESIWRLAVALGQVEVLPSKIEALREDATLHELFPWIGPFDMVWRVRYPHPPDGPLAGRPFVLRISSALGALPLDFGAPPEPIELPRQAP